MPSPLENYLKAASAAGCPPDQIERLVQAGIILPPRQLLACSAARMCDRPDGPVEVGTGGARGGGKSFWLLTQLGVDDCQRADGLKCLMLRKVGKSAVESLGDIARRVFPRVPHVLNARGVLSFRNGSRIIAGHFKSEKDIDAYLGLEYDAIGVEEATTLTSTKLTAIATCCRTSRRDFRPRMYYTTNPGGVGHGWFKRKFVEPYRSNKETETRFVPFTVDDNPFVNQGYIRQLDQLVGWMRRAWRFGDWDIAAGQFFTGFSREHHAFSEWNEDKAVEWFAGLDYGFTHPTVFTLACRDGDGNTRVVEEHVRRGWLVPAHCQAILALLARHKLTPQKLRFVAAGTDVFARESDGKCVAEEYKANGLRLTAADTDRVNGAATLLKMLGSPTATPPIKPTLFVHARCVRTLEQLAEMQNDPNRPEDVLKVDVDEDGQGGDDAYDALRYAVQTKGRDVRTAKLTGA